MVTENVIHRPETDNMWRAICVEVMRKGFPVKSRNGDSWELPWTALQIDGNAPLALTSRGGTISRKYAATELLWYLSRSDDVAPLAKVAPQYVKFANDGKAMGAYGKRWSSGDEREDQLISVYELLRRDPGTRQAVVSMWFPTDVHEALLGKWKDIPCTLSMQFLLRNDKLDLGVTMRSNDVWLGLPYDMFCFRVVQRIMACALGVGIGSYVHRVGSLHIYAKDGEKILKAIRETPPKEHVIDEQMNPTVAIELIYHKTSNLDACPFMSKLLSWRDHNE